MRTGSKRLAWVPLLAVAGTLAAAAPAGAACGGVKTKRASGPNVPGRAPLAIGDSVMLGSVPEVARAGYDVNVRGCRQMSEGLNVMRSRKGARRLPRFVVIALGPNGPIQPAQLRAAMRIAGRRRLLGLMTPRKAQSSARLMRSFKRRHPRRVVILDWAGYSSGHGGWFGGDGLHLGAGGAAGMGRLFRRTLSRVYPRQMSWKQKYVKRRR